MKNKKRYIKNPSQCPYCNSWDLCADRFESDSHNSVWRDITCNSCNKVWFEMFELVDVEPREEK
jgi:transcriptional regulator NrdR family protein